MVLHNSYQLHICTLSYIFIRTLALDLYYSLFSSTNIKIDKDISMTCRNNKSAALDLFPHCQSKFLNMKTCKRILKTPWHKEIYKILKCLHQNYPDDFSFLHLLTDWSWSSLAVLFRPLSLLCMQAHCMHTYMHVHLHVLISACVIDDYY